MAELEKGQLLNFDIDQYLKDGDATVAACAQAKAVADEIHEQPGLEPGTTEPKSAVLPLHHSSIRCSRAGQR